MSENRVKDPLGVYEAWQEKRRHPGPAAEARTLVVAVVTVLLLLAVVGGIAYRAFF